MKTQLLVIKLKSKDGFNAVDIQRLLFGSPISENIKEIEVVPHVDAKVGDWIQLTDRGRDIAEAQGFKTQGKLTITSFDTQASTWVRAVDESGQPHVFILPTALDAFVKCD